MAKKQKTSKKNNTKQDLTMQKMRNLKKKQIRLLIGGAAVMATAIISIKYRTTPIIIGFVMTLLGEAMMLFDYYKDTRG